MAKVSILVFPEYHPAENFPYPEHIDTLGPSSAVPTNAGSASLSLVSPLPVLICKSSQQFLGER